MTKDFITDSDSGRASTTLVTNGQTNSERVRPPAEHGRLGTGGSQTEGKAANQQRAQRRQFQASPALVRPALLGALFRRKSALRSSHDPARGDAREHRHEPWARRPRNQRPPAHTPPPARRLCARSRGGFGGCFANQLQLSRDSRTAQAFFAVDLSEVLWPASVRETVKAPARVSGRSVAGHHAAASGCGS